MDARWRRWLAFGLLFLVSGCGEKVAVEGKKRIESTEVFKNMKATKPPPPKVPAK
jgi:hypothetical protein